MIKFRNKKNDKLKKLVSNYDYLKFEIRNIKKQIDLLSNNSHNVYTSDDDVEELILFG